MYPKFWTLFQLSVLLVICELVSSKSLGGGQFLNSSYPGNNPGIYGYGNTNPGYPSSSGLSGNNARYPTQVVSKPGITTSHGYTPFGQGNTYGQNKTVNHGYPPSNGVSGHGNTGGAYSPFGVGSKQNYTNNYGTPSYGTFKQNYTNTLSKPPFGVISKQNYSTSQTNPSYGGGYKQNYSRPVSQPTRVVSKPSYTVNKRNQTGWVSNSSNSGNRGSSNSKTSHTARQHYHYSPPQQIVYTPLNGPSVTYPVYHGTLPSYVFQAQKSGSKYGILLAGLSLLNLGALVGTPYSSYTYNPQPGEICKFGIRHENGFYEESKIDCQLITHFIFESDAKSRNAINTAHVTNTAVNNGVTMLPNGTLVPVASNNYLSSPITAGTVATNPGQASAVPGPGNFVMLPNGTLVAPSPVNTNANMATSIVDRTIADAMSTIRQATASANQFHLLPNGSLANNAVTNPAWPASTTTTVVNAIDVKGKAVTVSPRMLCYMIRTTPNSNIWKDVPCELLQNYAMQSLKKSSAGKNVFSITMLAVVLAAMIA